MSTSAAAAKSILGMGNPLLDIVSDVDQAFLDKYGIKMNDAILAEEQHFPMFEEMAASASVQYIAGGATQNTIRVAQWMLQQPNSSAYIGCVGDDKFGKQLAECAAADGVAVHYRVDKATPTGVCACSILDKERSLTTKLDAANNYELSHLEQADVWPVVEQADIIYTAGFFLTVSVESIMKVAQHAKAANKLFTMNLSAPFISQFFGEPQKAALPLCSYLFGNETEAQTFAKANEFDEQTDVANIAAKIAQTYQIKVVITQGSDSTVVAQADGSVATFAVPKVESSEIVDTNGAGDAFVGGFLAGLSLGKSEAEAVRAGHWAAGYVIRVSGTQLAGTPDFKFE